MRYRYNPAGTIVESDSALDSILFSPVNVPEGKEKPVKKAPAKKATGRVKKACTQKSQK